MIDAGTLLRQLREEKGMPIEAMAAALKVSVAKLHALEEGRSDAFPNIAFVRALAMSVCKVLKVDHAAVLAKLPMPDTSNLHVDTQNKQPFKENSSRLSLHHTTVDFFARWVRGKYVWPAFILLAALFVYWWPSLPVSKFVQQQPVAARPSTSSGNVAALAGVTGANGSASVASQESAPVAASASSPTLPAQAEGAVTLAASLPSASAPSVSADNAGIVTGTQGEITLVATDESWVRIKDADGALLIRRLVFPGEQVKLAGKLPLRVTVGNVAAVALQYQGKNIDLSDHTRGNVARLDLE